MQQHLLAAVEAVDLLLQGQMAAPLQQKVQAQLGNLEC